MSSTSSHRISRDTALVAIFAALIACCAILPGIPTGTGVPITLQTFAVILAGAVLGPRRGFLAVLLYLAVGFAGLPVFSGGRSGFGVLAGPTAGYLIAFPLAALLCGYFVQAIRARTSRRLPLWIALAGLTASFLTVHPLGITGMYLRVEAMDSFTDAIYADLPFWPGDVVKNTVMGLVAAAVHRAFPDLTPVRRRRLQASDDVAAGEPPASASSTGRENIGA